MQAKGAQDKLDCLDFLLDGVPFLLLANQLLIEIFRWKYFH
jgi:hypothetical protein